MLKLVLLGIMRCYIYKNKKLPIVIITRKSRDGGKVENEFHDGDYVFVRQTKASGAKMCQFLETSNLYSLTLFNRFNLKM